MQLRFKVAGMSDMGLVRKNNEDNFQISRDLSVEPMRWINNEACLLTPQGALLVVADGMGGANAGEVASQIAIDTIKELFAPMAIANVDLKSTQSINEYLRAVVVEADARIKATAATRPETQGMGTTLVIGWLIEGKLYVAWCGDSRAYVFNPANGLHRLTKDHSYVQTLVDMGKLTDEQAFDYPQSNIITRCLCDSTVVAEADVLPQPYEVADGDIILLCTDGLCGMIRDYEIANILQAGPATDLTAITKNLIDGALRAAGADNVTVALLQVVSGGRKAITRPRAAAAAVPTPQSAAASPAAAAPAGGDANQAPAAPTAAAKKKSNLMMMLMAFCGILIGVGAAWFIFSGGSSNGKPNLNDSIDLINREDGVLAQNQTATETSYGDEQSSASNSESATNNAFENMVNPSQRENNNPPAGNGSNPSSLITGQNAQIVQEHLSHQDSINRGLIQEVELPVIDKSKPVEVKVDLEKKPKIKDYATAQLSKKELVEFVRAVIDLNHFPENSTSVPEGTVNMKIPTINKQNK